MNKLAIVFISILSASIALAKEDAGCTNATLNGAYGILRNGHAVAGSYITAVGVVTFDTIGNVSGHVALSTNGVFSHADIQQTYAINENCTGQVYDATGAAVQKIFVSKSGDRALAMSIEAGRTEWYDYARVGRNAYADPQSARCTVKNMGGVFVFQRQGHIPAGDLLATGVLTLDGEGMASAVQTTGRNGVFSSGAPIVGPYTVNEDCSGTFLDATGKVFSEYVVVGERSELFAISETSGNNVALRGLR